MAKFAVGFPRFLGGLLGGGLELPEPLGPLLQAAVGAVRVIGRGGRRGDCRSLLVGGGRRPLQVLFYFVQCLHPARREGGVGVIGCRPRVSS